MTDIHTIDLSRVQRESYSSRYTVNVPESLDVPLKEFAEENNLVISAFFVELLRAFLEANVK